ncbi:MAG: hypothetical protein ACK49R_14910 [Planctomycetota bacterium]|jgi:hypothetical protein|nr:hypothetical protein [Blastopirellula sp.]
MAVREHRAGADPGASGDNRRRTSWGWLTVFRFGLVLIALLLLNSFLVKAMVDSSALMADDLRITQTLQFALPLLMIFVEFWLYDLLKAALATDREA